MACNCSPPALSMRTGSIRSVRNPRGQPHSLGRPRTSIVITPDNCLSQSSLPRWPPPNTSTSWRTHNRAPTESTRKNVPGGTWQSSIERKFTPRGFPAPGGAPLQYQRTQITHPLEILAEASMTKEKAPLHDRMARPFTQASHERANEIFDDGLYHMSDRRNLPRALAYFKQVLKIDPNHVGALSYLGILSQDFCQNYLEAEQYFIRALALEPNNAVALGGYAVWQQNCACDMSQAETYFRRAIECGMLDISNEQCPLGLAQNVVLSSVVYRSFALTRSDDLLTADSTDVYNLTNYSTFLKSIQKDEESRTHMLKAFKSDPERPWLVQNASKFG